MYFDKSYNICVKYFSKYSVFSEIYVKNHDFQGVFMVFTMKIGYSEIFTIIFVISVSKYVNMGRIRYIVTKVGGVEVLRTPDRV